MQVFTYCHHAAHQYRDLEKFLQQSNELKILNDKFGLDGVLLFTSLSDLMDPWDMSHLMAQGSNQIPLIALTPNWDHPIITARRIASFQKIHRRPLAINWITGVSLRDYEKIGLELSKEERYEKLSEYIHVVNSLLDPARDNSFVHEGKYFKVAGHRLSLASTYPVFHYVSGASEYAAKLAQEHSFVKQISMAMPGSFQYSSTTKGVGLGLIARSTETEALMQFYNYFPHENLSEEHLRRAQKNTDSSWKSHLYSEMHTRPLKHGFYASPVKSFSELGFYIGDYSQCAAYMQDLVERGMDTFVVSLNVASETYHLKKVLNKVEVKKLKLPTDILHANFSREFPHMAELLDQKRHP